MRLTVDSEQLPVGWIKTKLGDVCKKVEYGSSAKSKPEGEIPVLRMGNIQNGVIDWNDLVYTTDQEEIDKYLLKHNDILFNRTNSAEHVGKTAIYKSERPAIFAGYLIRIHRKEDLIDADFLNYYLNSNTVREYGKSVMSRSVNQANINGTKLKEYPILLPPLLKQKQIVAILDEAFEGIDRAIANTQKNLTNPGELFESYLNTIFTQKGDGWIEKKLGDIATFRNGLNFTKSSKGESIKIVGVKDFQNHFWIQEAQLDSVTIDAELKEIDILRKGDILTVRSNGNKELIGRCILAGDISEKTSHSGFTIRIRIESENIYPQFIVYSLKSRHIRKQLIESGGGISISSLNQQGLSLIVLSFPTFVEQKAIVANIDELAIETQRLETIYRQKLAALNELKQSILQKAFTGELTADTANQTTKAAQEVSAA